MMTKNEVRQTLLVALNSLQYSRLQGVTGCKRALLQGVGDPVVSG